MLIFHLKIPYHWHFLKNIPKRFYWQGKDLFGCSATEKPSTTLIENKENSSLIEGKNEKYISSLINAYRRYGHLQAAIDPLELSLGERIPELDPNLYGLQKDDKEVLSRIECLNKIYSGNIGIEFMHLKTFEQFLAIKFPTLKRYSGEGAESMVIFFHQLIEDCPQYGIQEFFWGGAHRGRLALQNVLFQYPTGQLFRKLRGMREAPENISGMGDVSSHLHSDFDYKTINNEKIHVSTLPNPSHLEATIATLYGKARARAKTLRIGDYGGNVVGDGILAVHHHGDGAFTGQGIVWESLSMSKVPNFRIGGSIHLIVNNQLAFTADKNIGRSSIHCANIALAIDCPLICVNAENIFEIIKAAKIALKYRQIFRKEIFVELICYRRYGHNELDEPRFTQPKMYKAIDKHKCLVDSFKEELINDGIFTEEKANSVVKEYSNKLNEILLDVDNGKIPPIIDHFRGNWKGFKQAPKSVNKWNTGFNKELLKLIGIASVTVPEDFSIHPTLQKSHINSRLEKIQNGNIDWSTAESLAIGSVLLQGFDVRLSGQDVGRGTFSQRHAMLVCQKTDKVFIPLNKIQEGQKCFLEIANSPLSEAAIVGFEYGFAIENPKRLVIWEAQFGDFYNGAQVQIDTLIASGESKWFLQNGLVLLLPHGFDGAGPDHSSAHIERFLLLTDSSESQLIPDGDNINMRITNPTTSAQYFHLLRRQAK
uniref:Transket_pyr domain-containing protein n=1 Tax=Meloidogyne hapla TaxID=6305 RepID=A0A1I8B0X7_MELHA